MKIAYLAVALGPLAYLAVPPSLPGRTARPHSLVNLPNLTYLPLTEICQNFRNFEIFWHHRGLKRVARDPYGTPWGSLIFHYFTALSHLWGLRGGQIFISIIEFNSTQTLIDALVVKVNNTNSTGTGPIHRSLGHDLPQFSRLLYNKLNLCLLPIQI